jgi:hypothetical protein
MRKLIAILPLATSLAALSTGAGAATPPDVPSDPANTQSTQSPKQTQRANLMVNAGGALLGLIVSHGENGSVVAQHESHSSHASHASHSSSY